MGTEKFFKKYNPRAHIGKQYFDVYINDQFFDFFYQEGDAVFIRCLGCLSDAVELTREKLVEKYGGVLQCYPADCDLKLTTFKWEDKEEGEDKSQQPKANIGSFDIRYNNSYIILERKGKVPFYDGYYDVCKDFLNTSIGDDLSADVTVGAHPIFEYEGSVAPLWFYKSTQEGETEDNSFLFECAADGEYVDEMGRTISTYNDS